MDYAIATCYLGFTLPLSEIEQSKTYVREALAIFEEAGETWGKALALFHLAAGAHNQKE